MGALGSGPRKGIVYQKRGTLRVADIRDAIQIDIWDYYRSGDLERAVWIDDRSELVVGVDGQTFILKVRRKPYRNARFRMHYSFVCDCDGWPRHMYYHDGKVGCRKCLGLYYLNYGDCYSTHLIRHDYERMKEKLEFYEAHYAEYEQRRAAGIPNAWKRYNRCDRPHKMRAHIERYQRQVKVLEGRLWGNVARQSGSSAAVNDEVSQS